MNWDPWFLSLGLATVITPTVLTIVLSLPALISRPLGEGTIARLTQVSVVVGLVSSIAILALMLFTGSRDVPIDLGTWVHLEEQDFHFSVLFRFDRLSVPFAILTFVLRNHQRFRQQVLASRTGLCPLLRPVLVLPTRHDHREPRGHDRDAVRGMGTGGSFERLLVAFFQERVSPVRNGLRVWAVYRVADAAFLVAAVAPHHMTGKGDFFKLMGETPWPDGTTALASNQAFFVGILLLIAAAGKSCVGAVQWLAASSHGRTDSFQRTVFYGALSVHLGAFLLLRFSPIIEAAVATRVLTVAAGLGTACSRPRRLESNRYQDRAKLRIANSSRFDASPRSALVCITSP
ncbi:MAG: proton-conducting transporter membrane subunit [Pirellulaceae bacterium]